MYQYRYGPFIYFNLHSYEFLINFLSQDIIVMETFQLNFKRYTESYIKKYWRDIKKDVQKYAITEVWSFPRKFAYYKNEDGVYKEALFELKKNRDIGLLKYKSPLPLSKIIDVCTIWKNSIKSYVEENDPNFKVDIGFYIVTVKDCMIPTFQSYISEEYVNIDIDDCLWFDEDGDIKLSNKGLIVCVHHKKSS